MPNLTRSQSIGLISLLVCITLMVGWSAIRAGQSSAASTGITLREPPPQAPSTSPPVRSSTATPSEPTNSASETPATPPTAAASNPPPTTTPEEVVVHVAGAVRKPGVYHLRPGARNEEALKAAGGLTAQASPDAINLAARVEDGTQLFFPTRKEHPEGGASPSAAPALSATTSQSTAKGGGRTRSAHSRAGNASRTGSASHSDKLTSPDQGQVNLNTATAEELQRIPGIGPAMAERVIAFRQQNGGFHSVEDLMQVSGIGEKKFAKMQPFVRVK